MSNKILLVDDELNIRRSYKRSLYGQFALETAASGQEGLALLADQGPFAVVVSDMRMPVMNGIEFLTEVKAMFPDTVRMMLTGNADLQTVLNAVNKGYIFRFLVKPCSIADLTEALTAGLEQYRLRTAERDVLEKTLKGSIELLTDVLSQLNPVAFKRTIRLRTIAQKLVAHLKLEDAWQYELAAMFSQLGCITLPLDLLEKLDQQLPLSQVEQEMYLNHPTVGRDLLNHLPRLELIAQIVGRQHQSSALLVMLENTSTDEDKIALGAQILKLALDFDRLLQQGQPTNKALYILRSQTGKYNPHLLTALETVYGNDVVGKIRQITVDDLTVGMIAEQDICSVGNSLLVSKGQEITPTVIVRLQNIAARVGVQEPFWVRSK